MMMQQCPTPDLIELVGRLADDQLDGEARTRLLQLLREDPSARAYYLDYMELHAQLYWKHSGPQAAGIGNREAMERGLGTLATSGREVECREPRADSGEWRVESEGIGGQWPVDSGQGVTSGEWRVASEAEYPESPVFNLQISKSPNLQTPAFHSPLSTLHYWAISYAVATVFLAIALLGAWSYTITHPAPDSLATRNSRSGTHTTGTEKEPSQFTFVGRVSGMVDCQWSDETTATSPGAGVALNRRYALKSGLMEISYDSGAKVILQGPCDYRIESARGGFLGVGKLVARVTNAKPQATAAPSENPKSQIPSLQIHSPLATRHSPLFSVRTPTALVEDLGTEFGVEVRESGDTASHVFQGQVRVKVEGKWDGGRGAGDKNPESPNTQIPNREIILSAGQSARVKKDGNKSPRIVREEKASIAAAFVQHLPRRLPIKLFNTGAGLKEGDPDPHWQLVARSDDPNFKPRPAVVTAAFPGMWLNNTPRRSQWISTAGTLPDLPNDVTFTFRTTFELRDMVPGKAVLSGCFLADNQVNAIRINGRSVPVHEHSENHPFDRFTTFTIRAGFVEGENVLEIDVFNGLSVPSDDQSGPMGLRVELEGAFLSSRQIDAGASRSQKEEWP
jgi:hypothetical protein